MSILSILKTLFNKENKDFIKEAYIQLLNREPDQVEMQRDVQQMDGGKPKKVAFIGQLLGTEEAKKLLETPIQMLSNTNLTIANIIRTFYTSNVVFFVRSVYKEILGYELHSSPDLNAVKSLTLGFLSRTEFIANIIDRSANMIQHTTPPQSITSFQGYYASSWDWASEMESNEIIPLYNEEELAKNEPKGIDPSFEWKSILMVKKTPRPFVVSISQGQFWGINGGAVFTPEGKIVADVSQEMDLFQETFPYSFFANKTIPSSYKYSETVGIIRARYDINYFHWMFDVIARIDLLRKTEIPIDKYITNVAFPFQDELLTFLGIPREKRIQTNIQLNITSQRLLAPSYTGSSLGVIPKWACDFLRKELLVNTAKIPGYERIYISRLNANHRKVENHDEVMRVLTAHGFREVILEKEPIRRKIQIFNSAKIIVAPHGAGLTNLVFCEQGTKVIELFNPNWMLPCYWMISNHTGLDYYYLRGIGGEESNPVDIKNIRRDMTIDLEQLQKILSMAINGGAYS